MKLQAVIRGDETWSKIIEGNCSCGETYLLVTGSNRTFRRNGNRFVQKFRPDHWAWSAFRCSNCGECIDEVFVPNGIEVTP